MNHFESGKALNTAGRLFRTFIFCLNSGKESEHNEISQLEALMVLSEDEQLKYINQSISIAVDVNSNMKRCPIVDCEGVHVMEGEVQSRE